MPCAELSTGQGTRWLRTTMLFSVALELPGQPNREVKRTGRSEWEAQRRAEPRNILTHTHKHTYGFLKFCVVFLKKISLHLNL